MCATVLLALSMLLQGPGAPERIVPPGLPVTTNAGGEVLLHLKLDAAGIPERILGILDTPPFAEILRDAVRQWRLPATAANEPVRDVLVAGVFRSPVLLEWRSLPVPPPPAIGPSVLPFPIAWARPPYPPDALGDGMVIVEIRVGEDGVARDATVVHSAPGFDSAAVGAASRWRFRPAIRDGRPSPAVAYLVFGFRAPATTPSPKGR